MAELPNWPTPQMFPSRNGYYFDPGIPNRQLWALGMVVAQWSMTELIMHQAVQNLTVGAPDLWQDYRSQASFKHQIAFYKTLVSSRMGEPRKTTARSFIAEIQRLKSQRDKIMHGTWGGGMEGASWSSGGLSTTDGRLVPSHVEPQGWNLSFARLKQLATELSFLNAKLAEFCFVPDTQLLPPHGDEHL